VRKSKDPLVVTDLVRDRIACIRFPFENKYFEKTSADGYAYLGFSRSRLGLDSIGCYEHVLDLGFSLGENNRVKSVLCPADTQYAYTVWPCIELFRENCRRESVLTNNDLRRAEEVFRSIGAYDCGMHRYCDVEVNYVVPNMTSISALLYAYLNNQDDARKALKVLSDNQDSNGNWTYKKIVNGKRVRGTQEDVLHLGMMIFQLRKCEEILQIDLGSMIGPAFGCLKKIIREEIKDTSIGAASSVYLAAKGFDEELEREFLPEVIELLSDKNFRRRAYAAFAITR
tara:strand:+ start:451 stop:1305 length:855 start_codon:yes stop_codon:yes gene_type:complete